MFLFFKCLLIERNLEKTRVGRSFPRRRRVPVGHALQFPPWPLGHWGGCLERPPGWMVSRVVLRGDGCCFLETTSWFCSSALLCPLGLWFSWEAGELPGPPFKGGTPHLCGVGGGSLWKKYCPPAPAGAQGRCARRSAVRGPTGAVRSLPWRSPCAPAGAEVPGRAPRSRAGHLAPAVLARPSSVPTALLCRSTIVMSLQLGPSASQSWLAQVTILTHGIEWGSWPPGAPSPRA